MLFNSYEFILIFLPITVIAYFVLCKLGSSFFAQVFLLLASWFFYGWWNPNYLYLLLFSTAFNFWLGRELTQRQLSDKSRRFMVTVGVGANLTVIGFFKYFDFFITSINHLGTNIPLLHIVLPLAISFFTFQQIAYLVDAYRHQAKPYTWLEYAWFVAFFPQLVAGPIVHHGEMIGQFTDKKNHRIIPQHIAEGIFIFVLGLSKKVLLADTFAVWATHGFDTAAVLTMPEAWLTSLSYTLQLYFDFSGYSDMAIGLALLFNFKLPINFYSPYKAVNIQDFWRRWHMTLSRFLRDYLYISLGGNRRGSIRTYGNLMITFVLGGLWHGAGWNFIFWGFLHGAAQGIQRCWQQLFKPMPKWLAWFLTFQFVNIAWIFFRATSWADALKVLKAMFDLSALQVPAEAFQLSALWQAEPTLWAGAGAAVIGGLILTFGGKNSIDCLRDFKPRWYLAVQIGRASCRERV